MISIAPPPLNSPLLWNKKKCHQQQGFWIVEPILSRQDSNWIKEMPLTSSRGQVDRRGGQHPLPALSSDISHSLSSQPPVCCCYPWTRLVQTELILIGVLLLKGAMCTQVGKNTEWHGWSASLLGGTIRGWRVQQNLSRILFARLKN